MRAAVLVNRNAVDELHRQERQTVRRTAAVNEPSDVRVLQRGEDLPLLAEALHERLAASAAYELDRDALRELVVADSEKDRSHSADAELPHDAIRTDHRAGEPVAFGSIDVVPHRSIEKRLRLIVRIEERLDFGTDARVGVVQQRRALRRRQFRGGVEQLTNVIPERIGAHRGFISRRSHARAIAHSRLTVAEEIPSADAVSSIVSPP